MKKLLFSLLALSIWLIPLAHGNAATITTVPSPVVSNKPLEVKISGQDLGSTVYLYSWVKEAGGEEIKPSWTWDGVNSPKFQMSGSNGSYTFTIPDIKEFFNLTDRQLSTVTKLGFIAKNTNGGKTDDLVVDVVQGRRDAYSGGEGTAGDPFLLKTSADLQALASTSGDWTSENFFRMEADIDASTLTAGIGSVSSPFCATFDGNGHTIKNLRLQSSAVGSATGLFGAIKGGTVRSLGVTGANVAGATYVGILTGYFESGLIERCFTAGNVSGTSICVGGLVGENVGGQILNCYSGAHVENISDYATGGLVGKNRGVIRNTYSAGKVKGYDYVGGLVGANYGTVKNSIALNEQITSPNDFAARFGGNNNGRNDVEDNYSWDSIAAGHTNWTQHGDHALTKGSDRLTNEDDFLSLSKWDFNNVWEWVSKNGGGYPQLRNLANQECLLSDDYFGTSTGTDRINPDNVFVTVSPNPTHGIITVSCGNGIGEYALYSVNGQSVATGDGKGNNEVSFDFGNSPAGMYLLTVTDSAGNREVKKIIKN